MYKVPTYKVTLIYITLVFCGLIGKTRSVFKNDHRSLERSSDQIKRRLGIS